MFSGNAWHLLALRCLWWCKKLKEDWECRINGCSHVFRQCLTSVSITLSLMMQKVDEATCWKEDWECRITGCSHIFSQCLTFVSITLTLMKQHVEKMIGNVGLPVFHMFSFNAWHFLALRWVGWCKKLKEDWVCRINGCSQVFRPCLKSVSIMLSRMMQKVERGLEISD